MSGHALYHTIAAILFMVSLSALPFLAGIALLPIKLAVLEWSRKSELSADRAGLLGSQNPMAAQQLFMKMAGAYRGALEAGEMNLNEFVAQANEYASSHEGFDVIYKVLNTLGLTHPMHDGPRGRTPDLDGVRCLRPDPPGRVHPPGPGGQGAAAPRRPGRGRPLLTQEARDMVGHVTDAAKRAAQAARDAFKKAQTGA